MKQSHLAGVRSKNIPSLNRVVNKIYFSFYGSYLKTSVYQTMYQYYILIYIKKTIKNYLLENCIFIYRVYIFCVYILLFMHMFIFVLLQYFSECAYFTIL